MRLTFALELVGLPGFGQYTLYTYMGSPGTLRDAGFRDVTPAGQLRQVVRYFAGEDQGVGRGSVVAAAKARLL